MTHPERTEVSRLSARQTLVVASMLFGLFFGAGNLIFPVSMGQNAGALSWQAALGFCITGVGLPLLGIVAFAISESASLFDMCLRVGKGFAYFFTVALYLTIGPLFAVPRTATVSFQVGVVPLLRQAGIADGTAQTVALAVFSLAFFALVLFFSLRPSRILDWVGRILNPLFLSVLAILLITALVRPMGSLAAVAPQTPAYASGTQSFFTGFLEGYNTMDALASLAFGVILVDAIRGLGVKKAEHTASSAMRSGFFASAAMVIIYVLLTVVGAQSAALLGVSADGGTALFAIAEHYYGTAGGVLLGVIITVACLKTSVGLITSLGSTFSELFPRMGRGENARPLSYRFYALTFTAVSFVIANAGLDAIIAFSIPVLLFLYPLTIVLMVLCAAGRTFAYRPSVFAWGMGFTVLAAGVQLLSSVLSPIPPLAFPFTIVATHLPLADLGMGWVAPAIVGIVIGVCVRKDRV
ncbi:branched-chain amino acid transport system II carrier protein [Alloscardovia macacae]|uniref:Branched-chain amino acid transport system II carrier protein n=1 Tax=Alloscardovia macacae TaxID=1160091 RepID=A0A261F5J1_9BIFI|nr:branched-chain amino acid transport system II carrier protein [Alloscardovia macacae]OZG54303.1 branched-chain amino acid transport system II carrier protein [Alloscardovia macacae]